MGVFVAFECKIYFNDLRKFTVCEKVGTELDGVKRNNERNKNEKKKVYEKKESLKHRDKNKRER